MILPLLLFVLGIVFGILSVPAYRERYWAVALGLASFVILTTLNLQWPDFAPMGERLRDYAILSAVISDPLAPQEPWFAGFPLNYYLNWYRLAALPSFLGFTTWEIYHAAGPVTMGIGIAATALLLVAWTGSTPLLASMITVALWLGSNVAGLLAVLRADHNWWGPSRVLTGAINEFPAWSWLLGDLHPHFLNLCALPVALLISRKLSGWAFSFFLIAWCAWNYSANAWDTAPALVVAVVLLAAEPRTLLTPWVNWRISLACVLAAAALVGSALHIEAPHAPLRLLDFQVPFQSSLDVLVAILPVTIEPHTPGVPGSQLQEFFTHWGFTLALMALGFLLRTTTTPRALVLGLAGIVVAYTQSVAIFLVLLIGVLCVVERCKFDRATALLVSMLLVLLVPEVIFFDDPYGGDSERMNTIFKFYSFAWIPFGIATWVWGTAPLLNQKRFGKQMQYGVAVLLLALMLPWTLQTIGDRRQSQAIMAPKAQGLSHFERLYPGAGVAIKKLAQFARGITLEAENGAYSDGAFVSTLASQPSFLGWANHVGLLLRNPPELGRRQQVIRDFYEGDCAKKLEIMRTEGIVYAVFGAIEQRVFPQMGRAGFSCLIALIEEQSVAVYGTPQ